MGGVGVWGTRPARKPVIQDGLLRDSAMRSEWRRQPAYQPFERPSLPNELSKVQTERDVLAFAPRNGPLG